METASLLSPPSSSELVTSRESLRLSGDSPNAKSERISRNCDDLSSSHDRPSILSIASTFHAFHNSLRRCDWSILSRFIRCAETRKVMLAFLGVFNIAVGGGLCRPGQKIGVVEFVCESV